MRVRMALVWWWVVAAVGCGGSPTGTPVSPCAGAACAPAAVSCGDIQNDPNNCGACANRCGAQACNAGSCGPAVSLIPVSSKVSQLMTDLVLDGSYVYWGETGNNPGAIYRAPIGGGAVSVVATDSNPRPLTLSAATLVYGSGSYGTGGTGTGVRKVSAGGGTVNNIALNTGDLASIAVDSSNVYWTTYSPYTVVKAPLAGGTPMTLGGRPLLAEQVSVDATNVYWVEGGNIFFVPKVGGTPVALVSGLYARAMILQGGFLYFSTWRGIGDPGTGIFRVSVSGGTPVPIATGLLTVTTLTTDGTTVYWSDGGNNLSILRRAPAAGGGPFVSLTGYTSTVPNWSAIDANYVYWNDAGNIYKIAR